MSSPPPVTIGMPVCNGAAYIEQALAGIAGQSRGDFTLLIADNASTDATPDILAAWAARDARIVVHRHAENIGASANFRSVLDHAKTAYFMWHAHDDWLAPNYVETLLGLLEARPGSALACGATVRTEADGTPKRRHGFPDLADKSRRARVATLLRRAQAMWIYGVFRTEALRRVVTIGQRFGHPWAADRLMLLPLIADDRVCGSDATEVYNRKSKTSFRLYRPASPLAQMRFAARYFAFNAALFGDSRLSPAEKAYCAPALLHHACATVGLGHYNRFVKHPARRIARLFHSPPAGAPSERR